MWHNNQSNKNNNENKIKEKFAGEVKHRPQANKQGFGPISFGCHLITTFFELTNQSKTSQGYLAQYTALHYVT